MYCPQCGSEYVEGITECPVCRVALQGSPPVPDAPTDHPEPVVVFSSGDGAKVAVAKSLLVGIGVEFGVMGEEVDPFLHGAPTPSSRASVGCVALYVARADEAVAREVLSGLAEEPEEPEAREDPVELASPGMREDHASPIAPTPAVGGASRGYWREATRQVYGDPSWPWRVLMVAAILMVPYLDAVFMAGYSMVLMRDVAWGTYRGLPKLSEYREILRRGVDGFILGLGWLLLLGIPLAVIVGMIAGIQAATGGASWLVGTAVVLLLGVAAVVVVGSLVFVNVALLRSAVYQKLGPGFSPRGIRELIAREPRGFRRIAGLTTAVAVVSVALGLALAAVVPRLSLPPLPYEVVKQAALFVSQLVMLPVYLTLLVAYGLWARDTDLSSWPAES